MSLKKKLISVGCAAAIMFSAVSASAGTYIYASVGGKSQTTYSKNLGNGKRYLTGAGVRGSGTAQAIKIIKWKPDEAVATIYLSANHRAERSFTSKAKASDGTGQSYYIKWKGKNSSSGANVSIRN
ncbi:hypothetical protein [Bacillus sp. Hm123]|uniref:hypothetical protein n=1 Tax=Bacillus sp. Hm123 TaxID=3450745 RepID=UPI003F43D772